MGAELTGNYINEFEHYMTHISNLWRFAEITRQLGSHLALVPRYTAARDVICVMRGSRYPVLLQPNKEE
jgi:hypothetical protein